MFEEAIMSRRRLRITAAAGLLALVAASSFAAQPPSSPADAAAAIRRDAQQFGESVKHSSVELSRRMAIQAREAGRQLNHQLRQVGRNVERWWDGVRSPPHERVAADPRLQNI
jgi:hypothetical protein